MPKSGELLSHLAPVLPVKNLEDCLDFYRDVLGFKLTFSWNDPPEYAVLKRGGVSIHLAGCGEQDHPRQTQQSVVYVFLRDIKTFSEELNRRGLQPPAVPVLQPYGMVEFEVVDPQGHRIIFGKGEN